MAGTNAGWKANTQQSQPQICTVSTETPGTHVTPRHAAGCCKGDRTNLFLLFFPGLLLGLLLVLLSLLGLFVVITGGPGPCPNLTTVGDLNLHRKHRFAGCLDYVHIFHFPNQRHALDHVPEHHMLSIQVRRHHCGHEELGAVCVRSGVGHRQEPRLVVPSLEILILKFPTVNRLAAGSVTTRKVATLQHELFDDPVKDSALVV